MAGRQGTAWRGGAVPVAAQRRPAVIFHNLREARAALRAAAAAGRPVRLLTPPGGHRYLGANYLARCLQLAAAEYPDADFEAILDVGDDGAAALEAFRTGWTVVLFTGTGKARRKVGDVAEQLERRLLTRRPKTLPLPEEPPAAQPNRGKATVRHR